MTNTNVDNSGVLTFFEEASHGPTSAPHSLRNSCLGKAIEKVKLGGTKYSPLALTCWKLCHGCSAICWCCHGSSPKTQCRWSSVRRWPPLDTRQFVAANIISVKPQVRTHEEVRRQASARPSAQPSARPTQPTAQPSLSTLPRPAQPRPRPSAQPSPAPAQPDAKCIRWGEMFVWGTYPRGAFHPHVYIWRRPSLNSLGPCACPTACGFGWGLWLVRLTEPVGLSEPVRAWGAS